ncbi:MAG: hypothetical protein A2314_07090 [Elusimicrobia bacterium RIFOXYB2_FULL_50_12]|nr:MAG: hypothetical protein A2314_07090 [Elusimicrobia bacterium RIFOXYB2_FULL_50_12]
MKRINFFLVGLSICMAGLFGHGDILAQSIRNKQPAKKDMVEPKKSDIKVTFVELGSVNCIPCKAMQPVMADIEEEYGDQVSVVFYDVWTKEGSPFGDKYKIRAIPTQVFLDKDGKEFFRHQGFFPKEEIIKILKKHGVK